MCKISFETKKGEKGKGSGFFCEIDKFPIKYALFTNNHVLNESNIEIGSIIHFEYLEFHKSLFNSSYKQSKKEIKVTQNRKVFTNKELDYTCIELFESDGIKDFFKVDPKIFKDKNDLKGNDIFILQFPKGNDISFSYGKILKIKEKDNIILHSASTDHGSSGSPIIRRGEDDYIIGLHYGGVENKFNLATIFDSILNNIKEQFNEINCIYIPKNNEKEINLLHDYNLDVNKFNFIFGINEYLEVKDMNKKLFKESIDLYVNDKKINFDFKYKIKDSKEIKVKLIFKQKLTNLSFMFYNCFSLKSIDLSSFNTNNATDMSYMFYDCSSLNSIDISSFNTNNVTNMRYMFYGCFSLKSIDLSSFNTNNVTDMSDMLSNCSSLKSIDLSSFNTNNVTNMRCMFYHCSSLKSIDLSSFNTNNVTDMSYMFSNCSSLKSIDLSSFNTNKVTDMYAMFSNCSSLNSIDLSSFNTNNVTYMYSMFYDCSSLKRENIIINNNNDKLLEEINDDLN